MKMFLKREVQFSLLNITSVQGQTTAYTAHSAQKENRYLCFNTVWVSSHTATSVNDRKNDVAYAYNNKLHLKPLIHCLSNSAQHFRTSRWKVFISTSLSEILWGSLACLSASHCQSPTAISTDLSHVISHQMSVPTETISCSEQRVSLDSAILLCNFPLIRL